VADKPLASLLTPESRKTLRDYLSALQGPGLASVLNDGREVRDRQTGRHRAVFLPSGGSKKARPGGAAFAGSADITQ